MDEEQAFAQMQALCTAYAGHLHKNHHAIAQVMTAYQSYAVTDDEIERSIECLTSTEEIKKYLLTGRTKRVCTFFPLNLPVYSLVLFAVIPFLISDEVYLRPPQKMIQVFQQLMDSLCIAEFFPNIHVSFSERETFVQEFVAGADVTIFTGKESNARLVLQRTKKDSIFLFNGWGCNPIVVAADADVEKAVIKAAEVKLFNAGQDCAGPDNILVHKSVADEFLAQLQHKVSQAKVGSYTDPDVLVGRIAEESALVRLASFLLKHQDKIVYGGGIDFANTIVHPTMIVAPLSEQTNYEEFFSPIFYINIFDDDAQLAKYFDSPQYKANDMYVTLFGTSPYVQTLSRSIVYREQTILDVERGNSAYGGYSFGASFVASNGNITPRPILVPKEMADFIQGRTKAQAETTIPTKISAAKQKRIQQEVNDFMAQNFGDNLVFGFVFGSLIQNRATTASDIDTMVVLKTRNAEQEELYLMWLRKYHAEMGLTFDSVYPTELLIQAHLDTSLATIDTVYASIDHISEADYDTRVWTTVLSGFKRLIAGDDKLLFQYAKALGKHPKKWKEQMLRQIQGRLEQSDLGEVEKDAAMKKLRKMEADQIEKRFVGQQYLSVDQRRGMVEKVKTEFGEVAAAMMG